MPLRQGEYEPGPDTVIANHPAGWPIRILTDGKGDGLLYLYPPAALQG